MRFTSALFPSLVETKLRLLEQISRGLFLLVYTSGDDQEKGHFRSIIEMLCPYRRFA